MERLSYDKECMKMAILKHEQTFKEQVYELHRLYRIQKALMRSVDRERPSSRSRSCSWQTTDYDHHRRHSYGHDQNERPRWALSLDHHHHQQQLAKDDCILRSVGGDGTAEIQDEENEIELTLGPSSYYPKKQSGTPPISDSGRTLSSSSTGSNNQALNMSWTSSHGGGGAYEREYYGQRQQPPPPTWPFQVLSLNMT